MKSFTFSFAIAAAAVLSVSSSPLPTLAADAPAVTITLEPRAPRSHPPRVTNTRFETLRFETSGTQADVRSLFLLVEGKNRHGKSIGTETIQDIITHMDVRSSRGGTVDALPVGPTGSAQLYEVKDIVVEDEDTWTVRVTVKNTSIDHLRLTVCTTPNSPCNSDAQSRIESLETGGRISVLPATPLQGRWQVFRPSRRK